MERTPTHYEARALERASADPGFLMSHPQPLVLLPTLWFWRYIRRTNPKLHYFSTLVWAVIFVPLVMLAFAIVQPLWVQAIAVVSTVFLSAGIVEKALRILVVRRRRALASSDEQPEAP